MHAIFRICGNESWPGLQLVEKMATPLTGSTWSTEILLNSHAQSFSGDQNQASERKAVVAE